MNGTLKNLLKLRKDPVIRKVYEATRDLGLKAFLVGGAVRDVLLSLPSGQDYDFALNLGPGADESSMREVVEKVAKGFKATLFPLDIKEGVYRIVALKYEDTTNQQKINIFVDLSPLKGSSIEEDLMERDFTINAMAISLDKLFDKKEVEIIDPSAGKEDLDKKLLVAVTDKVFIKDPVRLLRAFRFRAFYNLKIEDGTRALIRRDSFRLKESSYERIRDEFFSILECNKAKKYVEELALSRLLGEIIPLRSVGKYDFKKMGEAEAILCSLEEIVPSFTSELDNYFQGFLGGISKGALLKFAALIHDVCEPSLKAGGVAKKLKLSKKARLILVDSAAHISTAYRLLTDSEIKKIDKYRFFREFGEDGIFHIFLSLAGLKAKGKGETKELNRVINVIKYFYQVFKHLQCTPLLTGSEVMRLFGIQQGEKVGEILKLVEEARAGGIITGRQEAFEYIKELTNKGGPI